MPAPGFWIFDPGYQIFGISESIIQYPESCIDDEYQVSNIEQRYASVVSQHYFAKPYQEIIARRFVKSIRTIIKGHIFLSEYDMTVHSIVIYF